MPTSSSKRWNAPAYFPEKLHGGDRDWIATGTHFYYQGTGPVVVLIHGVGLDLTMWHAQVAELSKNYTVLTYDMLGHGKSAKPPGPRQLKDMVNQLETLRTYFKIDKMALVGFSLGGFVAQAYTIAHPDSVEKLVILNSGHGRSEDMLSAVRTRYETSLKDGPAGMIDAALARWLSPEYQQTNPDAVQAIRTRLETNDREGFLSAYRLLTIDNAYLEDHLGEISCPTLVSTGELDSGSTPEMAKSMSAAIPGSELEILTDLRHMAPVEGAYIVNRMLLEFLNK